MVHSVHPLVHFLYLLMRDHLPAGIVEKLVVEAEKGGKIIFSNECLATYAGEVTKRLRPPSLSPLPAYADRELSPEGAARLVELAEDDEVPVGVGRGLPLADRDRLLEKVSERVQQADN